MAASNLKESTHRVDGRDLALSPLRHDLRQPPRSGFVPDGRACPKDPSARRSDGRACPNDSVAGGGDPAYRKKALATVTALPGLTLRFSPV
ncbi:MAG: hypothetical protein M3O36_11165 [Myxococcota bacterium]|nr:hypothetical protein [Myxococcota bacterium]